MRILIPLFMLYMSSIASAQSNIFVTPKRPIDCKIRYEQIANWIYNIRRSAETGDQVVFEFKTQYGRCKDGKFHSKLLDRQLVNVGMMMDQFIWPWQSEGVIVTKELSAPNELSVELTFNKNLLQKRGASVDYILKFRPGELSQYGRWINTSNAPYYEKLPVEFTWQIRLSLSKNNFYELKFK